MKRARVLGAALGALVFAEMLGFAALRALAPRAQDVRLEPLGELPLIEVEPQPGAGELLAVLISGDGGWARLARGVSAALAARGVPVIGLDSARYFWTRRTPEEAGEALARILDRALARWPRPQAILIGYSRGADVLPFMVSRLPARLRSRIALLAILGPGPSADFELHLIDLLRDVRRPGALAVGPELERLRGLRILCVYGAEEQESLCPRLPSGLAVLERRAGGHHFDADYGAIAERILAQAQPHG